VFTQAAVCGSTAHRRDSDGIDNTRSAQSGAPFHDLGLTPKYSSAQERLEVDGANAARDFLRRHGIPQADADTVWTAIALHTTPGIPRHMHPVIAFNPEYVTEGEM